MNVLPNELTERVIMCIRGFLNENPQLIHQEDIDNWSEDGTMYCAMYFSGGDFGKYALSNLYLSNNDEIDINKFIKWEEHRYRIEYDEDYDYDDLENIKDNHNPNNFTNIKDKINDFIGIYTIINIEMIFDLIKDIYANKDNEVYLK